MKKKMFTRICAGLGAAVMALSPMMASAATPYLDGDTGEAAKETVYNYDVARQDGNLKFGYTECDKDDPDAELWKVEYSWLAWQEWDDTFASLTGYNSLTEFLNAYDEPYFYKVDDSFRSDWVGATKAEYEAKKQQETVDGDLTKTEGYTDFEVVDKTKYDAVTDENLKTMSTSEWTVVDKAAYDKVDDENMKEVEYSDWVELSDKTKWDNYTSDNRKAEPVSASTPWVAVTKDEYQAYATTYPGNDGVLYKADTITYSTNDFKNWVDFDACVIADEVNGVNTTADNGACALVIANAALKSCATNKVTVSTINSVSQLPTVAGDKYDTHENDGIHNGATIAGTFVDITDQDFKIYYYAGNDAITVNNFYGILIAPKANVTLTGTLIGTVIADTVNYGNDVEIYNWTYPVEKGATDVKYFIKEAKLYVKEATYKTRTVTYKIRDYKYFVRDVVSKKLVRFYDTKEIYAKPADYVPKTGDLDTIYVMIGVAVVMLAGVTLIVTSRKKAR